MKLARILSIRHLVRLVEWKDSIDIAKARAEISAGRIKTHEELGKELEFD